MDAALKDIAVLTGGTDDKEGVLATALGSLLTVWAHRGDP